MSEAAKHTQGPWVAFKKVGHNGYRIHAGQGVDEIGIATVRGSTGNTMKKVEAEELANALLIAAAPDLLAVAEQILKPFLHLCNNYTEGQYGYLCNDLAEAITKAKGVEP